MSDRPAEPALGPRRRRVAVIAILFALPLIVAAALMQLFGAYLLPAPSPVIKADPAGIVALGNGIIIQADEGTVRREIIDWLNSNRAGERLFAVGGHQFVGDTAELTAESRGRLKGLAMFLRAEPGVTATVVAYAAPVGDLPNRRARRVVGELVQDGVAVERLGVDIRDAASSGREDRRLAIRLARPAGRDER